MCLSKVVMFHSFGANYQRLIHPFWGVDSFDRYPHQCHHVYSYQTSLGRIAIAGVEITHVERLNHWKHSGIRITSKSGNGW